MLRVAPGVGGDPVGRHPGEGVIPVDRIVTGGLPGVKDGDQTLARRVARLAEPAVLRRDLSVVGRVKHDVGTIPSGH